MFKLFSPTFFSFYADAHTNREWLMKYRIGNAWIRDAHNTIDNYLRDNNSHCLLFGSKAVEYAIRANRNNNTFKMQTNDYDVFSSQPKKTIIDIYNKLKTNKNIWNLNCSFARNQGTCTLFINEIKLIDVTYLNQNLIAVCPTRFSSTGIRFIAHTLLLSACTSILADVESVYMIPKTLAKLRILCDEFYFKLHIDKTNSYNIYAQDSTLCTMIGIISDAVNKPYDATLPIYQYYKKIESLNKNDVSTNSLDLTKFDDSIKQSNRHDSIELEIIHPQNGLPVFYRQTMPSVHRYFYIGSLAVYAYIHAFGNVTEYSKDSLLSSIFTPDIEMYVESVDYIIHAIRNAIIARRPRSTLECYLVVPREFPCMYTRSVRICIDQKYNIILYELTHERFIEIVEFKLPTFNSNLRVNCSCYPFLISHLLWRMSIYEKLNGASNDIYSKYSNIISVLSVICNNNINRSDKLSNVFRPHIDNTGYASIGNPRSIHKTNEYIQNSKNIDRSLGQNTHSNNHLENIIDDIIENDINIKYNTIITGE